jgi:hypothetical protein
VALSPPRVVLLTPITIVVAAVVVVVAPIIAVVVMTPIITPVIKTVILLVGARSPTNIFLDLLISLISICPLLCHREKVLDRFGPLAKKLGPKSTMVAKASDECRDSLIFVDVRDVYPRF